MGETLAVRLLLWAVPWMGAAIFALWRAKREFWRAFWLMSGAWAFVDAVIALLGLMGGDPGADSLRRVLWVNAGLDIGYVLLGLFLLSRKGATSGGFGGAVIAQGLFLLVFDASHAMLIG